MTPSRQLTMIVGPGRSGTSVLAILLRQLGYRIPQPEIPPDETNPKGFGESQWLVEFHQELHKESLVQNSDARPSAFADSFATLTEEPQYLTRAAEWLEPHFAESDFVLIKDPRLLWFTTLWEAAAAELGATPTYLTPLRHPTESVASKRMWYDQIHTSSNLVAGWINGMLNTERATRDQPRGFVEFDLLLSDWIGAVTHLDAQADLPPVRRGLTRDYRDADTYLVPNLRRSTAGWDELGVPEQLSDLAERVWSELLPLAAGDGPPPHRDERLDSLREEYNEFYAWVEAVSQSTAIASRRAGMLEGRRRERRKQRKRAERERDAAPEAPPSPPPAPSPSPARRRPPGGLVRLMSLARRAARRIPTLQGGRSS